MATRAEQLEELQTERTRLKTAIAKAQAGSSSFTVDGFSVTRFRIADLRKELNAVEKRIRRVCRGGRGLVMDMSIGAAGKPERTFDPLTGTVRYG